MRAALGYAVASGARRVVLSTLDSMVTAHRLYARLGFVAVPERDWGHEYVHLRVQTWTAAGGAGCARGVADLAAAAGRRGGRLARRSSRTG